MRWKPKASEPGLVVSGVAHAAVLAAGLFAFASAEPFPDAQEGIPVEIVTDNMVSEVTRGERDAKAPQPTPKPRAERVAEKVEQKEPGEAKVDAPAPPRRPAEVKVDDKPVEAAEAPPPVPPARPDLEAERRAADARAKAAEAKAAQAKAAERAAERAAEIKAAEAEAAEIARQEARQAAAREAAAQARAKAEAEAKARAVAEAKAKAEEEAREREAERARKVAEAKARQEAEAKAKARAEAKAKQEAEARAQRTASAADKFDPGSIQQLLQSKDRSQSSGSAAPEVNKTAALGTATGNAQRLNPSQRDALAGIITEQLHRCWIVPVALQSAPNPPIPTLRIRLNQDGSLSGEPTLANASSDPLFQVAADSATRAARRCAPLKIPAQFVPYYQDWKDLRVNFNLRDRV